MLDTFLEHAYVTDQARSLRNEMAEAMTALPNEMLHKLASGKEKLAFHGMGGGKEGGCWLDQFQGTSLYEQAIQLEEKSIQLEAQSQQRRAEEREERDSTWDAQDAIRLKKRMLELELRKQEAGGGEGEEEEPEEEEEELEPEEKEAAAALGSLLVASMRKQAGRRGTLVTPRVVASMRMRKVAHARWRTNPGLRAADSWGRDMAMMKVASDADRSMRMKLACKAEFEELSAMEKMAFAQAIGFEKTAGVAGAITKTLAGLGPKAGGGGIGSALKGAWEGAKRFGSQALTNLKAAPKGARWSTIKDIGQSGLQRASKWGAQNPLAAGALGAGALGTAALGGAALS